MLVLFAIRLPKKAYQETAMMAQSFSVTDECFMLIKMWMNP